MPRWTAGHELWAAPPFRQAIAIRDLKQRDQARIYVLALASSSASSANSFSSVAASLRARSCIFSMSV